MTINATTFFTMRDKIEVKGFYYSYLTIRDGVHCLVHKYICITSNRYLGREFNNLTELTGRLLEVPLPGGLRAGCQVGRRSCPQVDRRSCCQVDRRACCQLDRRSCCQVDRRACCQVDQRSMRTGRLAHRLARGLAVR